MKMAYQTIADTNEDLVQSLKDLDIIKSDEVTETMRKVDRKFFTEENPFTDRPQKIGYGATISAPHMHACALELLKDHLKPGSSALDIGSGSGYLTACFGLMVEPCGKVTGVEHIPELVAVSKKNISESNPDLMESGIIEIIEGDGRLGFPINGPYDAIHIGAAAENLPDDLIEQLKPGGRLVSPVGKAFDLQHYVKVDKGMDGSIETKQLHAVRYVPLTSVESQMSNRLNLSLPNPKRWNFLIRAQWKALKSLNINSVLGLRPVPCCEIQYFVPKVGEKLVNGLAERCGFNLRSLGSECQLKIDPFAIQILTRKFPKLESLNLKQVRFCWSEALLELDELDRSHNFSMGGVFDKLTSLNLEKAFDDSSLPYHSYESVDPLLFKMFAAMPHLETLSLSTNTMINGSCLFGLPKGLKSLDLTICRRIETDTLCSALEHFSSLKILSLYSCHKIQGKCLMHVPESLEDLDISFCNELDSRSLIQFLQQNTNLKTLRAAHLTCLDSNLLLELSKHKRLQSLDLGTYYTASYYFPHEHTHKESISEGLKMLANLSSLRVLDLSKNDFVDDETLYQISHSCRNLEDLNVSKAVNCTETGFSMLGNLQRDPSLMHFDPKSYFTFTGLYSIHAFRTSLVTQINTVVFSYFHQVQNGNIITQRF